MLRYSLLIVFLVRFSVFNQTPNDRFSLSIGYYGDNIIHPGMSIGGCYNLFSRLKIKSRLFEKRQLRFGDKTNTLLYYAQVKSGFYYHPNNHNGWFGSVGAGFDRIKGKNGNILGYNLNIGYLIRAYNLKTYELTEGKIKEVKNASSSGMYYSFSPVFGRDFFVRTGVPLKTYLKPIVSGMKYNHSYSINTFFEIEFVYTFNKTKENAR